MPPTQLHILKDKTCRKENTPVYGELEVERLWRDQVHDSCKSSVDIKLYLCLPAREQQGDREAEEVKKGQRDQDRKQGWKIQFGVILLND